VSFDSTGIFVSKAGQFIANIQQSKCVDYFFPIMYATIRTNFYIQGPVSLLHMAIDAPLFALELKGRPPNI
jgi:hypothetical protein